MNKELLKYEIDINNQSGFASWCKCRRCEETRRDLLQFISAHGGEAEVGDEDMIQEFDQMLHNCRHDMGLSTDTCRGCLGYYASEKLRSLIHRQKRTVSREWLQKQVNFFWLGSPFISSDPVEQHLLGILSELGHEVGEEPKKKIEKKDDVDYLSESDSPDLINEEDK
jgi:hypothetical protein